MIITTKPNGSIEITDNCRVTKELYTVRICAEEAVNYNPWSMRTMFIQDAFPTLSQGDREFLISGTSPKGWNELFGSSSDEDEA